MTQSGRGTVLHWHAEAGIANETQNEVGSNLVGDEVVFENDVAAKGSDGGHDVKIRRMMNLSLSPSPSLSPNCCRNLTMTIRLPTTRDVVP